MCLEALNAVFFWGGVTPCATVPGEHTRTARMCERYWLRGWGRGEGERGEENRNKTDLSAATRPPRHNHTPPLPSECFLSIFCDYGLGVREIR